MKERFANCCLGVFAKHWTPGQVKTRLAATIGQEKAAEVYYHLLETTVLRLKQLKALKILSFTPDDQERAFDFVPRSWIRLSQGQGDLGVRMERFFGVNWMIGYDSAVLIGSDTPHIPLEYIERAFDLLASNDAVFGPSVDGGYYLIGLRCPTDPFLGELHLFENMPWSTAELWTATQLRLKEAQISFATLPTWYDVDTLTDLERMLVDINNEPTQELSRLARKLKQIL